MSSPKVPQGSIASIPPVRTWPTTRGAIPRLPQQPNNLADPPANYGQVANTQALDHLANSCGTDRGTKVPSTAAAPPYRRLRR